MSCFNLIFEEFCHEEEMLHFSSNSMQCNDIHCIACHCIACMMPCWKINSFLSEISVCWSCTEKITIKIERAFSVILRALPATRRSFQQSPQKTSDLIHNWQLQMQDGIFQARPLLTVSLIRRLYVDINVY